MASTAEGAGITSSLSPSGPDEADLLRLRRWALWLAWASLAWMTIEGAVAVTAGIVAGSVALIGFGIDSAIEGLSSVIIIWLAFRRFSEDAERRAQRLVAISFFLLAPYVAVEAARTLINGEHPETSVVGMALTVGAMIFMPIFGIAKKRVGERMGSAATAGEGVQNLLCAYLAAGVLVGLAANSLFGAWWLDPIVAFIIAGVAIKEGREAWEGTECGCGVSSDMLSGRDSAVCATTCDDGEQSPASA